MIQITPQMRILVAIEAVDGRKGIDSLARLCQEKLQADPFSGCLFVFRSRRGTSIRILVYDGQGFWLAQKRKLPNEKSIQTAFKEVSDALIAHQRTRESRVEQERLVSALQDRKRLAYVRYRGGVDTQLNALDADRPDRP